MGTTPQHFGRYVYGLGVLGLGALSLRLGDFISGEPVPKAFPHRVALAYVAGTLLFVAGAAVGWRRTAAGASAVLAAYFGGVAVVLMNGRVVLAHYAQYGAYFGAVEQLCLAAGALIVFASTAPLGPPLAAGLTRGSQAAFALCTLFFGGAHFIYMNLTAPLVPKWLPPNQVFWGYATGLCFFAAGLALMTRLWARLAAVLLTAMLASFALLVHAPTLLANAGSPNNWNEALINFAILGAAWVVADSLARPDPPRGQLPASGADESRLADPPAT